MTGLFHITERDAWQQAARDGEYRMSTRDVPLAEEGFIHCSLPRQLRAVAEAVYGDADDLVVLVIDDTRLPSPCGMRASMAASSTRTSTVRFRRVR